MERRLKRFAKLSYFQANSVVLLHRLGNALHLKKSPRKPFQSASWKSRFRHLLRKVSRKGNVPIGTAEGDSVYTSCIFSLLCFSLPFSAFARGVLLDKPCQEFHAPISWVPPPPPPLPWAADAAIAPAPPPCCFYAAFFLYTDPGLSGAFSTQRGKCKSPPRALPLALSRETITHLHAAPAPGSFLL